MQAKDRFDVGDTVLLIWRGYYGLGHVVEPRVAGLPLGAYQVTMEDGEEHLAFLPALWPWPQSATPRRSQLHPRVGTA